MLAYYMPYTMSTTLLILVLSILTKPFEVDTIIVPILQARTQRYKEAE